MNISFPHKALDINMDVGECNCEYCRVATFEALKYVTSVNLCAGLHGGNPNLIGWLVEKCFEHNVAIGVHPGYPDKDFMGRVEFGINPIEIGHYVKYQIGAVLAFTSIENLQHIKLHGQLYHRFMHNRETAAAVIEVVKEIASNLIMVVAYGSPAEEWCKVAGLKVALEVFADRKYETTKRLLPRAIKGSVLNKPNLIVEQFNNLIMYKSVSAADGTKLKFNNFHTICLHSDNPASIDALKKIIQPNLNLQPMKMLV